MMDVTEIQSSPLFTNKKISRRLSIEAINKVLEELLKKGNIEWTDKSKRQCLVMWRTPEEWGKLIYKWAMDKGHKNSVCTLFEITNGEDTVNEEFNGLENWLLLRALKSLEAQKKAEVILFNGSEGVKFF
jgi:ESCRT-II complex subunit VPS25